MRLWSKSPGFTTVALLTLGLGIGASSALVGQINAVFFKPLPVRDAWDLRILAWTSPRPSFVMMPNVFDGPRVDNASTFGSFSYPVYAAMRDNTRAFAGLACWLDVGEARPVVLGDLGFGVVQFVSGNFFDTVRVRAAVGRVIETADDGLSGWSPVAVVSHAFWQRTYGGDPNVVRRTINLNGRPFTIVGVLPEGFGGLDPAVSPDVFAPIGAITIASATTEPLRNPRLWNPCRIVGRLRAGASSEEARLDLERSAAEAISASPPSEPYDPPRIHVIDGSRGLGTLREATSTPLLVMFGVVAALLVATCANIAGLLLVHGSARQRELATRLALGAPRARIVRQLLTESLVLAVAGGMLGVLLAYTLTGATRGLLSQFMPTMFGQDRALGVAATLDGTVLGAAMILAMAASLLFGALPALLSSQIDLMRVIRQSSAGVAHAGRFRITPGQLMVFLEAAVAMTLIVAAGLFLRTMTNLRGESLGISPEGLIYARVEPRAGALPPSERQQFFENAIQRLQSLPGVIGVSAGANPPMAGATNVGQRPAAPVCTAKRAEGRSQITTMDSVAPGFFSVLGIRVKDGREFTWADNVPRSRHVVVNETFAARYLEGGTAVGQLVTVGVNCTRQSGGGPSVFAGKDTELTVVGVVADVRNPRSVPEPTLYFPLMGFTGTVTIVVRSAQEPATLIATIRGAIREVNAHIPTFSEATVADLRERALRRERLLTSLLLLFGLATLIVCAIGVYGLLSYGVTRRRAEISVRMAIGAGAPSIVRMVLRESLAAVLAGMITGVAAAMALSRWSGSLLYGVSAADPLTVAGAASVLMIAAVVAAVLPARAATKIDPVLALRQ
jgi:predicted permease